MALQTPTCMQPRLHELSAKKLIGLHVTTSIAQNHTGLLWQTFMPRRGEIAGVLSADLFSLQVYPAGYFLEFDATREFTKWALLQVDHNAIAPAGMEEYYLPGGLYAVFSYKGSSTDTTIFNYIFSEWLPASNYVLDDRPHFEVLGEKYKNDDPTSEEEIWIPVKPELK